MIPNWPIALQGLASIKTAMDRTPPDRSAALKIWEDEVDHATFPTFQPYEPGQALPMVDPRIGEVRVDIERLEQALKDGNHQTVDSLLDSAGQKIKALIAEAPRRQPSAVAGV
jgi:hypothetical protein